MCAGGQFFNLFNLGKNDLKTLKTKELKNGRLAMVSHCRTFPCQNAGSTGVSRHQWLPLLLLLLLMSEDAFATSEPESAVQLAVFGYGAQAVITGEGPFKNLTDHLSNPTANNILTNFGHPAV